MVMVILMPNLQQAVVIAKLWKTMHAIDLYFCQAVTHHDHPLRRLQTAVARARIPRYVTV